MKRFIAILISLSSMHSAIAQWARHGVVNYPNFDVTHPISVARSEDKATIAVYIPATKGESGKGYFLIRTTERRLADKLDFRSSMGEWGRYQEFIKTTKSAPYFNDFVKKFYSDMALFEEITLLEPKTLKGIQGIFLNLNKKEALRTYIVYDFLPMGGSHVMDGGLWLTYDIPSFVSAITADASEARKGQNTGRKTKASPVAGGKDFRIENVNIEDESDGTKSIKVKIAKTSSKPIDSCDFGVKLRVWEQTISGELVLADTGISIEWDLNENDWKHFLNECLICSYQVPNLDSGRRYYGFSASVICNNLLQDSWGTSPDLLTHLLSYQSLDTNKLKYLGGPRYVFHTSYSQFEAAKRDYRNGDKIAAEALLQLAIKGLKRLQEKCPNWEPSDVKYKLKDAEDMLASIRNEQKPAENGVNREDEKRDPAY
jgi:hypothetical protein